MSLESIIRLLSRSGIGSEQFKKIPKNSVNSIALSKRIYCTSSVQYILGIDAINYVVGAGNYILSVDICG